MEKLNGWIPVKERLPETETEVLVLCPILGEWRVRVAMLTKRLNLWVGVGGTLQGSFFFLRDRACILEAVTGFAGRS